MTQTPMLQALWPGRAEASSAALGRDALLVLLFSLLTALCAQVSVPLPFSPVPVTGQTFAVLLSGVLPFLLGDAVKALLAAGLLPLGRRWIGRTQ